MTSECGCDCVCAMSQYHEGDLPLLSLARPPSIFDTHGPLASVGANGSSDEENRDDMERDDDDVRNLFGGEEPANRVPQQPRPRARARGRGRGRAPAPDRVPAATRAAEPAPETQRERRTKRSWAVRAVLEDHFESGLVTQKRKTSRMKRYENADYAKKTVMVRELAETVREAQLRSLTNELGQLQYGASAAETLTTLARKLKEHELQPVPDAALEDAAGTVESVRRGSLMKAVQQVRDNEPYPAGMNVSVASGMYRSLCAYDALLWAAGTDGMMETIRRTATLRMHQQRLFDGRDVCAHIDTALLTLTHTDVRALVPQTYTVMERYAECFVSDGRDDNPRSALVHGQTIEKLLDPLPSDPPGQARIGNPARYIRDGEVSGRTALAIHFATLEKLLMMSDRLPGGKDAWESVRSSERYAGIIPASGTAAWLEMFDGRLATDYMAMLWRVFSGDEGHDAVRPAGKQLPRMPRYLAADPAAVPDPLRSYMSLADGGAAATGAQTDRQRELRAREYIRRVVYTSAAYGWFLHSTSSVYLFNMLMAASLNTAAFAKRSYLTAPEFRLADERDAGDQAALAMRAHREVSVQLLNGQAQAVTDSMRDRLNARLGPPAANEAQLGPLPPGVNKELVEIVELPDGRVRRRYKVTAVPAGWVMPTLRSFTNGVEVIGKALQALGQVVAGGAIVFLVIDGFVFSLAGTRWLLRPVADRLAREAGAATAGGLQTGVRTIVAFGEGFWGAWGGGGPVLPPAPPAPPGPIAEALLVTYNATGELVAATADATALAARVTVTTAAQLVNRVGATAGALYVYLSNDEAIDAMGEAVENTYGQGFAPVPGEPLAATNGQGSNTPRETTELAMAGRYATRSLVARALAVEAALAAAPPLGPFTAEEAQRAFGGSLAEAEMLLAQERPQLAEEALQDILARPIYRTRSQTRAAAMASTRASEAGGPSPLGCALVSEVDERLVLLTRHLRLQA